MGAVLSLGTMRQDLESERRRNALELIGLRSLLQEGRCHPKLHERLQLRFEDLESRQRELGRIRDLLRCTSQ